MPDLLDLPNELIYMILQCMDGTSCIPRLALVSCRYYNCSNNIIYKLNIINQRGSGALWAVKYNELSAVGRFLNLGLDVHTLFNQGSTLLQYAAIYGSVNAAELLLQQGADFNATNDQSKTPLYYAIRHRHKSIIRTISKHIIDINTIRVDRKDNLTPLHAACKFKFPSAARIFLSLGCDYYTKDANLISPLQHTLNGLNDNSYTVLTILVDFGLELDRFDFEYFDGRPVSSFKRGLSHMDPKVRDLFTTFAIQNKIPFGDIHVGRPWMVLDSSTYEPAIGAITYPTLRDIESQKPTHSNTGSSIGDLELNDIQFPGLDNILDFKSVPISDKWSLSNAQKLIMGMLEQKISNSRLNNQSAPPVDPFPPLVKDLPLASSATASIWAGFHAVNETAKQLPNTKWPNSKIHLYSGDNPRARRKKKWQPFTL